MSGPNLASGYNGTLTCKILYAHAATLLPALPRRIRTQVLWRALANMDVLHHSVTNMVTK